MFAERHFSHIYVAAGYTDLRSGVNSLASIVQDIFNLDPFSDSLFLFCGRRADRMKALYWDKSGFVMVYKRIEDGRYRWPRKERTVITITEQQFEWLMTGMDVHQNPSIRNIENPKLA